MGTQVNPTLKPADRGKGAKNSTSTTTVSNAVSAPILANSSPHPLQTSEYKSDRSASRTLNALPRVDMGPDLVTPIVTADETRAATLSICQNAKQTLDLSTHALEDENYVAAIREAASRNVHVRILVSDPRYAGYSKKQCERIRARLDELAKLSNVEVRNYPNKWLQFGTSAFIPEFHTKILLADGKRGMVGDANLYHRPENLGAGLLFEGALAANVEKFFSFGWAEAGGAVELTSPLNGAESQIEILNTRVSDRNIKRQLIDDIQNADKPVFLMQYLLSDPDVLAALIELRHRKPDLDIQVLLGRQYMTAKVLGHDVRIPFNLKAYRDLTRAGINAALVSEDHFVHGKLAVIGSVTHLGSADLTLRGLEGNLETNLRIDSPEVAQHFVKTLRPFVDEGQVVDLTRWTNARINTTNLAERGLSTAVNAGARLLQAKRITKVDPVFARKFVRIAGQVVQRQFKQEDYRPASLDTFPGFEALDADIRARFDVKKQTQLGPRGQGVFLVAGHTPERAQVISELGAQIALNGDIGPGIYLTNDTQAAREYSVLHGAKLNATMIVYEADLHHPFHLPAQRAEYEEWLALQPDRTPRNFWQLLPDFCAERGYDCAVMDHFEGKDRNYVTVFDREKVRPVESYELVDRQKAGWKRAAKASAERKLLGTPPAATPSQIELEQIQGKSGDWTCSMDETIADEYQRQALAVMTEQRGLIAPDKLNQEIAELQNHEVFRISSVDRENAGMIRMIRNYNIVRYPGFHLDQHEQWKHQEVAEVAFYAQRPEDEFNPDVWRAAIAAAKQYRLRTGGADALYLEARPEHASVFEELGFEAAGTPFQSRAWTGSWIPMILPL
jgi:phosphatidylserine/phosphatidylglycerophosphate/cardiolipin synthase-like enzyme